MEGGVSIRLGVWALVLAAAVDLLTSVRAQEKADARATFTNPVVASGADPWVIRWRGNYYFCQSRGSRGIWISKAARLEDIGKGPWARVWSPPSGQTYSRELWAPELHYLRGQWYIYFAADDGRNENHRIYVLEGTSQDPRDGFEFKGQLALRPDRWAIDGTVLAMSDGRLHFIWSGWEGSENVAQNLYIAPMTDPLTIAGERSCLSKPDYDWEKRGSGKGLPTINEGPEVLWHVDKLFLLYSASGSWGDDYCLGQLTWTGGDVLSPASWVKKPVSVFARTQRVFGPGHCSFTKSPDEREDWIIYHAARRSGSGWDRDIRIQPFTWAADGSPRFGEPIAPGVPLPVPSGESSAGILPARD
jgi:GH43 family beta-xylosidase